MYLHLDSSLLDATRAATMAVPRDFFAAGLAGAVVAAEGRPWLAAAVAMWLVSQVFNQPFLVTDILPMTVPPAIVLIGLSVFRAPGRRPRLDPLTSRRAV